MLLAPADVGAHAEFVYLWGPVHGAEAAVVDPAWDVDAIFEALAQDERKLVAVFLTHHHHNHLNGLSELLRRVEVPVYAQRAEVDFAPALAGFEAVLRPVSPGEDVQVGALTVTCVHTPGHTPGSQCLAGGGALLTGDTLFVNACGRCDLPGGDAAELHQSLHRRLAPFPDEVIGGSGHDYGDVRLSSLGRERRLNPYFALAGIEEFLVTGCGRADSRAARRRPRAARASRPARR